MGKRYWIEVWIAGVLAIALVLFASLSVRAAVGDTAHTSSIGSPCLEAYSRLLGGDQIRVRMVFGYKDTRPARFVGDRHERLALVMKLIQPCKGANQACGFQRDPKNADRFTKRVRGPHRNSVDVELYVVHSSVGSDDRSNRKNPLQDWQSEYAQKAFYGGIRNADIVFYNGHSRFGGGPDFQPPTLSRSNAEPDAAYYRQQRPGFDRILASLRARAMTASDDGSGSTTKSPAVLGLFSCESSAHFEQDIAKTARLTFVGSNELLHYADAHRRSLETLSGLLAMRCEIEGVDLSQLAGHSRVELATGG